MDEEEGFLVIGDPDSVDHPVVYPEDFELGELRDELRRRQTAQEERLRSSGTAHLEQEVMALLQDLQALEAPLTPPPERQADEGVSIAMPTEAEVDRAIERLTDRERRELMAEVREVRPDYDPDADDTLHDQLRCCISQELLRDPVMVHEHTFDRTSIEDFMRAHPGAESWAHPITRRPFARSDVHRALVVREMLDYTIASRRERVQVAQEDLLRRRVTTRLIGEREREARDSVSACVGDMRNADWERLQQWREAEKQRRGALLRRVRQSVTAAEDPSSAVARGVREDEYVDQTRQRIAELEQILRERNMPLCIDHKRMQVWERPRDDCASCSLSFRGLRRPHHCRRCGRVMCIHCLCAIGKPEETTAREHFFACGRCRHVCARTAHQRAALGNPSLVPSDRFPQWVMLRPEEHRLLSLSTPFAARMRQVRSAPLHLGEALQATVVGGAQRLWSDVIPALYRSVMGQGAPDAPPPPEDAGDAAVPAGQPAPPERTEHPYPFSSGNLGPFPPPPNASRAVPPVEIVSAPSESAFDED